MNTKQASIILGVILGWLAPFLIDRYINPLTTGVKIGLYIFLGALTLYLSYVFLLKDLLNKKEEKPKKQIDNYEAIQMLIDLKKDPLNGDVDNYIEEVDYREISAGKPGHENLYLGVQARGYFDKMYCYLLVDIYNKKSFDLSKPRDEAYTWEEIRQDAEDRAEQKHRLSTKKVTKRDPDTGESLVEITEENPQLPYLLPKENQGESFTL